MVFTIFTIGGRVGATIASFVVSVDPGVTVVETDIGRWGTEEVLLVDAAVFMLEAAMAGSWLASDTGTIGVGAGRILLGAGSPVVTGPNLSSSSCFSGSSVLTFLGVGNAAGSRTYTSGLGVNSLDELDVGLLATRRCTSSLCCRRSWREWHALSHMLQS